MKPTPPSLPVWSITRHDSGASTDEPTRTLVSSNAGQVPSKPSVLWVNWCSSTLLPPALTGPSTGTGFGSSRASTLSISAMAFFHRGAFGW